MTHPIFSIFYIYSPSYSRGLRFLDQYILIKITFLFAMLPYYLTENEDFTEIKKKRSVEDMKKTPGDLEVAITKVIKIFYSFFRLL